MLHRSYFLHANQSNRYLYRYDTELIVHCAGFYSKAETFENHYPEGREDYYLIYMAQGQIATNINSERSQIREGDCILYHPQTAYHHHFSDQATQYYWLHFSGSKAHELVNAFKLDNQNILSIGKHQGLSTKFEALFSAFESREDYFHFLLSSSLIGILKDISEASHSQLTYTNEARLSRALSYIHAHFDKDISISSLARLENLSVSRFRSLFKDKMGLSPIHYIASIRIAQAKDMLSYTDLSIKEISYAVGYRDPLYFTRVFKRHTDQSPSEFRLWSSQNG